MVSEEECRDGVEDAPSNSVTAGNDGAADGKCGAECGQQNSVTISRQIALIAVSMVSQGIGSRVRPPRVTRKRGSLGNCH